MQRFLRFLMLAVLFLPFALQAQNTLTVCTGTSSNEYVPFQGYNADYAQHNQMIYPANMLTTINGQAILQMVFYIDQTASNGSNTSAERLGTWTVSLGETTETTLTGLDNTTTLTEVYEGYFDCSTGTLTIEFDNPYLYNGGNLLVDLNHTTGSWNRWYFLGVEATGASYTYGSQRDFLPQCTFTYGTPPSCTKPTALTYSLTPGNGTIASLSWTETGTATAWQICLNGDENNLIDATTNPYELTGLTPETAYTAKVRAYCDATDQSDWSTPVTFIPTDAYIITVNDGTTTNGYVPVYGTWVDNITKSQFIIPANDLTAILFGTINKLTFYANNASVDWGAAQFDVYLTETNETTLSSLADYSTMTQVYAGSLSISDNKMEVNFTTPYTYMGGNLMIGFLQTVSGSYVSCNWLGITATGASMGGYGSTIIQRDFLPKTSINYIPGQQPDCMPVSNLTASNITSSSVTLTWVGDASSYTIYDMSDTSIVMNGITDNSYTITDLNPNTNYLFGVQANCIAGDAITVYTSARTTCAPMALPFTEEFSASLNNDPCWNGASGVTAEEVLADTALTLGNITGWSYQSSESNGIAAGHYRVNIYGQNCKYWLVTPEIDLSTATSPLLTFDAAFTVYSGTGIATDFENNPTQAFMILVTTDNGQTWTSASNISLTSIASTTYLPQYIDLSAYAGETVRIAFYAQSTTSGGDNNLHIDNISIDENTGSICYPISDLVADSITANSIFLSWSDGNNTGASYTIYNMADTSVVAYNVSDLEYEVTGLTGSTNYTFGVAANCSATDASILRTVSATTDCENGSCQITITGTDSYGDGWNGASITIMQNGANVGSFTLLSGTATKTENFSVCSGIPVSFVWNSGTYDDECDLTIYDGGNSAVFTANGDDIAGTFYTLANACPSCMPATALTIDNATETSITISWTGTAASYDVYNGENFEANVTTTSYTFTGLTTATGYVFGVQAICSADDSATVATIIATTSCATTAINLPFTETFNLTSGTRNCWTTIDADNDGFDWTTLTDGTGADQEAMLSYSFDNGTLAALTPNNWLVSPKLHSNAGSNVTMEWTVSSAPSYPAEHYGVYVSTTTIDTNAFTMVDEWTISNGTAETKNIDLSAYAGQDFYVAFRHHNCTDQYVLKIDDVQIYEGAYVPDTLTVTFEVDDATMGTTIPAPGTYLYLDGDTIHFGSQANAGFHFLKWEITMGGQTQEFGPQYANGYYVLASSWMHYETVVFKAFFEAGNPDSTTITYAVNDPTMGTITPAPGTYTFYVGNSIIAEATPNTGYALSAWVFDTYLNGTVYESDTIYSTNPAFDNPINFGTLSQSYADYNATITITALFEASAPTQYLTVHLTTNNTTLGTVTPDYGTYTLALNETLVLTATPNADASFDGWRMIIDGQTVATLPINPYPLTVNENILSLGELTVMAVFSDSTSAPDSVTIILNTADATMGTTDPAPGIHSYAVGDYALMTAVPNEGYHFLYWIETATIAGMTMSDTIYSVTAGMTVTPMHANVTFNLTAYFAVNEPGVTYYNVSAFSANTSMGNVSSNVPLGQVAENTVVTVTATPRPGFEFVHWVDEEGNVINATNPYTFTVTEDITLIAIFGTVGINDIDASDVLIYAHNNTITVRGAEGHDVSVYDMNGRCIYQRADANETENISMSSAGIYLVRVDNAIFKKVVIVK